MGKTKGEVTELKKGELFILGLLIFIGAICSVCGTIEAVNANDAFVLVSCLIQLYSYAGVVYYSFVGYKKGHKYFNYSLYAFGLLLMGRAVILPSTGIRVIYMIAFTLVLVLSQRLGEEILTFTFGLIAFFILIGLSCFDTYTLVSNEVFSKALISLVCSKWTLAVLMGTFIVTYKTRLCRKRK